MTDKAWNDMIRGKVGVRFLPRKGSDLDQQGITGTTTGSTRACNLHGCTGRRVAVRWSTGHLTLPCSKGIDYTGRFPRIA